MKFKHIESLFRIIRAFLNFLFLIFIIYLFIYSFIHSLLFFLPPSNTILSRLRYSITFLHPRVCPSAYCRRCRVPIVSWLELCCLASRSDSRHVITRWLDDRRGIRGETETKREGRAGLGRARGRRTDDRYGMHEVRFLLLLRGELEKPRIYRDTWSASRKMRSCLDKIIARLMHEAKGDTINESLAIARFFIPFSFLCFPILSIVTMFSPAIFKLFPILASLKWYSRTVEFQSGLIGSLGERIESKKKKTEKKERKRGLIRRIDTTARYGRMQFCRAKIGKMGWFRRCNSRRPRNFISFTRRRCTGGDPA